MITEQERQAIADEEQLRLLPIFYWVLAALDLLFSSYGLIYILYGVLLTAIAAQPSVSSEELPAFVSWFMYGMGAAITGWFVANAVLKLLTGFWIKRRRRRVPALLVAGLTCLSMPFGTIIGVFTLIVLLRPSVAALFGSVEPVPEGESLLPEVPKQRESA